MKQTPKKRSFRINPVAAGCAVLLITANAAHAQQTADTMVVTGIRASIESAISQKKNAVGVIEAIAPEDIGKLPDASIADSINRLPGVAGQRNIEGRSQQLSIRGMPPDFSTTLLNGREQANPNDSRGVEYDAYPSELINGVTLHKSPDATLMGQGISGTVNMNTVRPLSVKGRQIVVGAGIQTPSSGVGPSGNMNNQRFSYVDQFNDGMLGIAIGATRRSGTSYSKSTDFWDSAATFGSGEKLPFGKNVALNNGMNQITREGVMAVVELKPNNQYSTMIDVYSSTTDRSSITRKILFPDMNNGTLSNAVTSSGTALAGDISGRSNDHVLQAVGADAHDKNFAIGWNNKFKIDKKSSLTVDLSKSSSKRTETILDSNARATGASTILSFDARNGFPVITNSFDFVGASNLQLGSQWGNGWLKKPRIEDDLTAIRVEYARTLDHNIFSDFTIGLNQSKRTKVLDMTEGSVTPTTTQLPVGGSTAVGFNGSVQIPTWNPLAMVSNGTYTYTDMGQESWAQAKRWTTEENIRTLYSKLDIETTLFNVPTRGNIGLQVVSAEQAGSGNQSGTVATWNNSTGTCPTTATLDGSNCFYYRDPGSRKTEEASYTDVLPSLNLAFSLPDDQIMRFGAGKMVARPTMRDMRANAEWKCWQDATQLSQARCQSGDNSSGNGGNPKLEPFRATTFDLGYEKYFGKKAYVGVAGFYRDLDTFIYSETIQKDFVNQAMGTNGVYPLINYTAPKNGKGGSIQGLEFTANAPLDLLSPSLSGFGVYVSHSNTSSQVAIPNTAGGSATIMAMPGLSRKVTNMNFYYEKNGFSARLGQRSRSDFVGQITSNEYNRELIYVKAEKIYDAQIGYEFKEGPYRGLGIYAVANNLTDAAYENYKVNADGTREPKGKMQYGKSFGLNVNYKF
ncbi:MAG: TonB-dependent receptor [Pseudomonadota bacterium]|jgi:TonB-dependent receptor